MEIAGEDLAEALFSATGCKYGLLYAQVLVFGVCLLHFRAFLLEHRRSGLCLDDRPDSVRQGQ
jgi:hypothetical protein